MKKIAVFLIALAFGSAVFAEDLVASEVDTFVADESADDDFDDIFADAEDVDEAVIVEEKKEEPKTVVQAIASAIHVSGNLTADIGLAGVINSDGFDPSGYLDLYNYFYIDVRPNDVFSFHTDIYSTIKNPTAPLYFETFYFDYVFLNNIFISAGKKSIGWGNTRLFNDDDYYSEGSYHNTNILSDSGSYVVCQLRYPWSSGTLSLIPMCAQSTITSGTIGYKSFQYALSYETVLMHTNTNIFGRLYSGSINYKDPLVGLELKRTIAGFDCYGQGIVRFNDITDCMNTTGYNYLMGTVGIYRLWDSFDPNVGFNIEYQVTRQHASDSAAPWCHLIAFEGGIKRLGKAKNQKIGVEWHHNVLDVSGELELAYVISGIFPYANWTNAVRYYYEKDNPLEKVEIATTISLDLGY